MVNTRYVLRKFEDGKEKCLKGWDISLWGVIVEAVLR